MELITIFPSIRFETEWGYPKTGKKSPSLLDKINYRDSLFISSKILLDKKKSLPQKISDEIDRVRKLIIDPSGKSIDDFSIIFDKKLDDVLLKSIDTESVQLFNYFAYIQNIDHHNPIDFIKIKFFDNGLKIISINNEDVVWTTRTLYMLNQTQNQFLPLHFKKDYDEPILLILEDLSKKEKALYKKILTAITLFNQACRINRFNQNSAIVLITSAFEALLQIPRYSKKDNFSFAFKLFWGFNQRIEDWAAQLYELRNQIVHGAFVEDKKLFASTYKHYQHFNIGREIFHSSLLILLDLKGIIKINRDFRLDETRNLLNKIVPNKEKAEAILKAKKKYNYVAFKKNIELYKEFIRRVEGFTSLDYSAKEYILETVKMIFKIMFDWTNELIQEKSQKSEGDKLSKYTLERWKSIQNLINQLNNIKWSDNGKYQLGELLGEIEEELRKLFPVVHKKNEFKFDLSEFGSRCLEALWATY
jgi:hypothetical protein